MSPNDVSISKHVVPLLNIFKKFPHAGSSNFEVSLDTSKTKRDVKKP